MASKHPWDTVLRQRLSRRRLLAASVAVGAASAAVACGGSQEAQVPRASPTAGSQLVPVKTRGGVYRAFGYDAIPLDTYDPHQTQFGPLYIFLPNTWLDSTDPTFAGRSA